MGDRVINWHHIKEVWDSGADALVSVASDYGITLPEISIHASKEGWGDRGAEKPLCPNLAADVLDDKQVQLAHKTDLGRLRLLAAAIMEQLQYEVNADRLLKSTERLAKIYVQIIPLERKVFGLDVHSEDIPDGIIINIGGKKVEAKNCPKN